nr:MAG TPA: Protection of telomeres protein poz1, sheterin, hub, DNA BINDING.1A [Caudoviricetes sp.]
MKTCSICRRDLFPAAFFEFVRIRDQLRLFSTGLHT